MAEYHYKKKLILDPDLIEIMKIKKQVPEIAENLDLRSLFHFGLV